MENIVRDSKFKIWIINGWEELPIDKEARLMRMGTLAMYLSDRGHSVTWWSSTFIHGKKKYHYNRYKELDINPCLKLILLHSPVAYKKNISPKRIIHYNILAKELKKHSFKKDRPDIIICSWPTPQFAKVAVEYGKKNNVPGIIDIRDLWPDIYYRALPRRLMTVGKKIIALMKKTVQKTLAQATGIVGVVPSSVEWGCKNAGRTVGKNDRVIFIGNNKIELSNANFEECLVWWKNKGISQGTWNMCFIGTLGHAQDLATVIQAVKELAVMYKDIRLIIGGKGDMEEELKAISNDCDNIIFAGWLNQVQMNSLMLMSSCGLYCMKNTEDFYNAFGNKPIQYLSAGLPILSSLQGYSKRLLKEKKCGLIYNEGDVNDCKEKIIQF